MIKQFCTFLHGEWVDMSFVNLTKMPVFWVAVSIDTVILIAAIKYLL